MSLRPVSERAPVASSGNGGVASCDPTLTLTVMPIPLGNVDVGGYRVRR
jgi:hypothetical protein